VKSKFPVLQMHSKISFLPNLKNCIITKSLLTHFSYSLCPADKQTDMAVIQKASEALLGSPGSRWGSLSCFCRASATVRDEGAVCGSDVKPWWAGQRVLKISNYSSDSCSSALHSRECRWEVRHVNYVITYFIVPEQNFCSP